MAGGTTTRSTIPCTTPRVQRSCRRRHRAAMERRTTTTTKTKTNTSTLSTRSSLSLSLSLLGPDRFIPDRQYVDTPRARHALWSDSAKDDDEDDSRDDLPVERQRHDDFQEQQLRRVLFANVLLESPPRTPSTSSDDHSNNHHNKKKRKQHSSSSSLLGLGRCRRRRRTMHDGQYGTATTSTTFHPHPNPMSLDILRSPWMVPPENNNNMAAPRAVSTNRCFTLGVDGIDPRDELHVISAGPPGVAVAMWDTVGFHNPHFDCLTLEDMGNLTALQWRSCSHDDTILAVGGERSLQVWDMTQGILTAEVTDPYTHSITAMEWMTDPTTSTSSPWGMLVSTLSGIQLYDLRLRFPHVFMYDTSRRAMDSTTTPFVDNPHRPPQQSQQQQHAAKLQLQPDGGWTLAAALPQCHKVALWDLRRSKMPFQTMEHDSVKGMQFCPLHRNTLATGGADGIRLWNVQSGGLRRHAPTVAPVNSLTWSTDRTEFMTSSCEGHLGVYQTSSDFTLIRKLEQWTQPRVGPIVALERMYGGAGENSGRVLSVHSESLLEPGSGEALICWEPFPARTATAARRKNTPRHNHHEDEHDWRHTTTLACSPVVR
jgi:hypothetical protein